MKQSGFTLLEVLLYLALFVSIMIAIVPFTWSLQSSGTKANTNQQLQQEVQYAAIRLRTSIQSGSAITTPEALNENLAQTLQELILQDENGDDITLWVSGGQLWIEYQGQPQAPLTSSNITITNLTFSSGENSGGTATALQFELAAHTNTSSQRQEYNAQTSIVSGAVLRNAL